MQVRSIVKDISRLICHVDANTIVRLEEEWIQTNVEDLSPQAHAELRQREEREMAERRLEEGTYEDMVYGMLLGFLLSFMMCFFMVRYLLTLVCDF